MSTAIVSLKGASMKFIFQGFYFKIFKSGYLDESIVYDEKLYGEIPFAISELYKLLQSCSHHLSYRYLGLWFYRVNAAFFVLLFISELAWIKNSWRRINLNPPVKQNLRMTFTFKNSLFDIY